MYSNYIGKEYVNYSGDKMNVKRCGIWIKFVLDMGERGATAAGAAGGGGCGV